MPQNTQFSVRDFSNDTTALGELEACDFFRIESTDSLMQVINEQLSGDKMPEAATEQAPEATADANTGSEPMKEATDQKAEGIRVLNLKTGGVEVMPSDTMVDHLDVVKIEVA